MTTSFNHCGDCGVCCKRLRIPEITWMGEGGKPKDTMCDKWCNGCTIYEERPTICTEFDCLWLKINSINGSLPVELRPDKCHVMVHSMTDGGIGYILLEEVKENSFDIMNMTPEQERLVAEVIKLMANQTMPTELHVRTFDWKILKANIGQKENNNNADLQQDQEHSLQGESTTDGD